MLAVVGLVSGLIGGLKSLQQPETWQGLATTTTKYMEYMKDAVNTSLKDSFTESWGITDRDDEDYYSAESSSPGVPPGGLEGNHRAMSKSSLSELGQQGVILIYLYSSGCTAWTCGGGITLHSDMYIYNVLLSGWNTALRVEGQC